MEALSRTELLFGKETMEKFAASHVAVFGLGGVGGHAAEALVRSGIGALTLIDNDKVSVSNLNRQIFATVKTVGMDKVDAAALRLREINPAVRIEGIRLFYLPENAGQIDLRSFDYVVDAIDTVSAKIALAEAAVAAGVPLISSMGTGNKLDPTALEVADLSKTSVCPLARVMRRELAKRGIRHLKVVYSKEIPLKRFVPAEEHSSDPDGHSPVRHAPGSVAFVPAAAGLIIAGEVIKDLAGKVS